MFFKKKINPTTLAKMRQHWTEGSPSWFALEMNQSLTVSSSSNESPNESYALELHEKGLVHRFQWQFAIEEDTKEVLGQSKAIIKNKVIFEGKVSSHDQHYTQNFYPTVEGCFHHFFIGVREQLVACGKRPAHGAFNPQEGQGKEWLRVSLEVLKKALENVRESRENFGPEVLQGLLFCGLHPTQNKFTFRLRLFNLDIEVVEDETNSLRVMVFDKKNKDSFSGLEPALKMVFSNDKAPVIDHLIKLLPYLFPCILAPQTP